MSKMMGLIALAHTMQSLVEAVRELQRLPVPLSQLHAVSTQGADETLTGLNRKAHDAIWVAVNTLAEDIAFDPSLLTDEA